MLGHMCDCTVCASSVPAKNRCDNLWCHRIDGYKLQLQAVAMRLQMWLLDNIHISNTVAAGLCGEPRCLTPYAVDCRRSGHRPCARAGS